MQEDVDLVLCNLHEYMGVTCIKGARILVRQESLGEGEARRRE